MEMDKEIKDKVVLVTGGAAGVGARIVNKFFDGGAKVDVQKFVGFLDIAEEAGLNLEEELSRKSNDGQTRVKFFKCDITVDEELDKVFDYVTENFGYIDVVINNAGIMNDKIYKTEINVNFLALVTITLKAYQIMKKDEGGRGGTVINVSSVAGLRQAPTMPVYSATKSAILQFSNCLGLQYNYERTGVRVIAVCFGPTDTGLITEEKVGFIDEGMKKAYDTIKTTVQIQSPESAVAGVIHAFERGESGSTWLAACDEPPLDYTDRVKGAYAQLFTYNEPIEFKQELMLETQNTG